jgi:hypothetical protein
VGFLVAGSAALLLLVGVIGASSAGAAKTVPTCPGIPGCRHSLDQRAGWEGFVTNSPSHCSGRVMKPYLENGTQAAAWTEIFCPSRTQLTIRSRLQADYPFADLTVAQRGCSGKPSCVVTAPRGFSYYHLACPKSTKQFSGRFYFSDLVFYGSAGVGSATTVRSRDAKLAPFCQF